MTSFLGLALQIEKSKRLKEELSQRQDSFYGCGAPHMIAVLEAEGFENVLDLPFRVTHRYKDEPLPPEDVRDERLYLFWHKDGILAHFDTFSWGNDSVPSVNECRIYYNLLLNQGYDHSCLSSGYMIAADPEAHRRSEEYLRSSGYWSMDWSDPNLEAKRKAITNNPLYYRGPWIRVGDSYGREALRFTIKRLRANGTFLAKWRENPVFSLNHHGDTKEVYIRDNQHGCHDEIMKVYERVSAERFEMLPAHVREAMGSPCRRYGQRGLR